MTDLYTADNFSKHLNTKFSVNITPSDAIDIELVAVDVRKLEPIESAEMERFSTVFYGPAEKFLPQQTYDLVHPEMGDIQLFLVALGKDQRGYRYEAVFNRFKKSGE
jgi:hypothetical protein